MKNQKGTTWKEIQFNPITSKFRIQIIMEYFFCEMFGR